jgi:hypothetical protein
MTDTNMSLSTGGAGQLPQMPKQGKQQKQAESTQQPTDSLSSSDQQKTSTSSTAPFPILEGANMSIMSYLEHVDKSKDDLSYQLLQATLTNYQVARWMHFAMGANAATLDNNKETVDELQKEMTVLTDLGDKAVHKLNSAITEFNQDVKKSTQDINKDIQDYNDGTITADELKSDLEDYKNDISEDVKQLNSAIDEYNDFVIDYNKQVDEINQSLQELGITYQMDPLPTVDTITTPDIPTDPGEPPIGSIPTPKPIPQVDPPEAPPSSSTLQEQLPPIDTDAYSESVALTLQNLSYTSDDSDYTSSLLKQLNSMLPPDLSLLQHQQTFSSTSDGISKKSPVIKNLNQIIVRLMNAGELVKKSLENFGVPYNDELFNQIVSLNLKIMADSGLIASTVTFHQLSNKSNAINPTDRAIDVINGVSNAQALKHVVQSGQVRSPIEILINSHESTQNMPDHEKSRLIDQMTAITNLNLLHAATKQLAMPIRTKGLVEQVYAQGVKSAGLDYDRTPSNFNHALQNRKVTVGLMDSSIDILVNQHQFSNQSAVDIVNKSYNDTIMQMPFQSYDHFADALTTNFMKNGIANQALARNLSMQSVNILGMLTPLSPGSDSTVSSRSQLAEVRPENVEKVQSDIQRSLQDRGLDSTTAQEITTSLMKGLASSPQAFNDHRLSSSLTHGFDVAAGLGQLTGSKQLRNIGVSDPAVSAAILSVTIPPLSRDTAFQLSTRDQMTERMMMDPQIANDVSSHVSVNDIVGVGELKSRISNQLQESGLSTSEAEQAAEVAVDRTLGVPAAYSNNTLFRSTLDVFLSATPGITSQQATEISRSLDTNGIVNGEVLRDQITEGLVASGSSEQTQIQALSALSVNEPFSSRTFRDEITEQLVATTGMSYSQATDIAQSLEPGSFMDVDRMLDRFGEELQKRGFDNSIAEPVLNNALYLGDAYISAGKFTETVRDLLSNESSIDPKQAHEISAAVGIEGFIQRDRLKSQVKAGISSQGASDEEAEAMASRASESLFQIKSSEANFNGIQATIIRMKQSNPKQGRFLESSIQSFFDDKGIPQQFVGFLGRGVTKEMLSRVDDLRDADSYFENLQASISEVIQSNSHDFDFTQFVSQNDIDSIRADLGVSLFDRAEVFQNSVFSHLMQEGIEEQTALQATVAVREEVLRTPGLFNQSQDEVKANIATTLTSLGIVDSDTAQSIASSMNLDLLLNGSALDSLAVGRLLDSTQLHEQLMSRVESMLSPELTGEMIQQVMLGVNELVFGSPALDSPTSTQSPGLSDLYAEQIGIIAQDLGTDRMDAVQQHFHQYKQPSADIHSLLRNFSETGMILTKFLLENLQGTSEEEMIRASIQRSV